MDALVAGAEAFIQVFRTAADVFVGFTTGIIPIVVVFLTAVNALVKFIGEERVCLLYTSPSPRDVEESRMPSSA